MCGTARQHASLTFKNEPNLGLQAALRGALEDLLVHQFVLCPDGRTKQVLVGAGMGQRASREIADTTFYELAERE